METKKLKNKITAYLRKKKIETVKKDNELKVSKIVTELFTDKTPKQAITMFKQIEMLFDEKLDEKLKDSLESVTEISKYRGINI